MPNSARHRLKEYFSANVGRVLEGRELAKVAAIGAWARRVRELREIEGMQISSHLDRTDLRPGQYILESLEIRHSEKAPTIERDLRLEIIERDGFTCTTCGRSHGDEDPSNLGRPISLYIDRVDVNGPTIASNLRVACSVCSDQRSNEVLSRSDLVSQVRRASKAEQLAVLAWLKKKYERPK